MIIAAKNIQNLLLLSLMSLPLAACWNLQNPRVEGIKPDTVETKTVNDVPVTKVQEFTLESSFNNQVDILWVMDTSESMICDQANLKRNIGKFADAFTKNQGTLLDFHIGVTATWDSALYQSAPRDCELGELRPVGGSGDPKVEGCQANAGKQNFVDSKTPNLEETLGLTLNIGTQKYNDKDPSVSGPNKEELFSPVRAALSGMNANFRRSGAHLAVIFVTDTDDATPSETSQGMAEFLKSFATDKATVSTFGVMARYDELMKFLSLPVEKQTEANAKAIMPEYPSMNNNWTQCKSTNIDPDIRMAGEGPYVLQELLGYTNGFGMDLQDRSYGEKLAKIGSDIVRKISRKSVKLEAAPNLKYPITVTYADNQTIKRDDTGKSGWKYDSKADGHYITISENVQLNYVEGAKIKVSYTAGK